jgi:hypothetical protein
VLKVEVLNGCGVPGLCDSVTTFLRLNKMDVIQTGNYYSYNVENTTIIDRKGKIVNAQKIAAFLGLDQSSVIQQINNDYLLDVTVVIGKDFNHIYPIKRGMN